MTKAFTFGKYYPFHEGHRALINFALLQCDELTVLVCASNSENISGELRASWIRQSFLGLQKLKIQVYEYSEDELPNTSESSKEVSKIWASQFKRLLPKIDYVITSEKYGDYIADFMGIKHLPFNIARDHTPISATAIRNDLDANWSFLPYSVKSSFIKKVVILGTESSGKSTLCKTLSKHFNCDFVPETARSINAHSNECTFSDLTRIADAHSEAIKETISSSKRPLILIDTDINTTESYANFLFQKELITDQRVKDTNQADLYLYLDNDCEYIQDGTRLSFSDRDQLNLSHLKTLKKNNVNYIKIGGDWNARRELAIKLIDKLVKNSTKLLPL